MPALHTLCSAALALGSTPVAGEPVQLARVEVVGMSPVAAVDLPRDWIPAGVQTARASDIERSQALDLSSFLNRRLGSVHLAEMQGWTVPEGGLVIAEGIAFPVLIVIALAVAGTVVLNRSRFGFNLRVSGANAAAARTAGVNPKRMILITIILSGAIAGMIGLGPLLTEEFNYGDQFPKSLGFTGIAIALLGRNHPVGVAAAALVWATIERATQPLSTIGIPQEIGVILQGSFLLAAVIAYEVVKRWADAAEARAAAGRTPDVPMAETAIAETGAATT